SPPVAEGAGRAGPAGLLSCVRFRASAGTERRRGALGWRLLSCVRAERPKNFLLLPRLVLSFRALTVGLVRQCQTIHGRDRTCIPPRLPPEWVTTLFFIIMGIISLTVTCGLLVASHWRREATKYARWIAFTGMILFCMAALIFPIGFYINEVGGQPYKLPNNTVVGSSYVLFVLSIFFTIVGLLFAGKVCLPG
uniref:Modulator of smoothened n=1 Tax=Gallus gallus TaxID=9031 RepID=A0A8V0Z3N5_CHICK